MAERHGDASVLQRPQLAPGVRRTASGVVATCRPVVPPLRQRRFEPWPERDVGRWQRERAILPSRLLSLSTESGELAGSLVHQQRVGGSDASALKPFGRHGPCDALTVDTCWMYQIGKPLLRSRRAKRDRVTNFDQAC